MFNKIQHTTVIMMDMMMYMPMNMCKISDAQKHDSSCVISG